MAGVSIVGLSGSMIKDTVKDNLLGLLRQLSVLAGPAEDLPVPEPTSPPQSTSVLIGVFFILFAQIL